MLRGSSRRPASHTAHSFSRIPQVHYTYRKLLMLQEPLLVVVVLYLLFLLVVVYVRLDFTISKVCHPAAYKTAPVW